MATIEACRSNRDKFRGLKKIFLEAILKHTESNTNTRSSDKVRLLAMRATRPRMPTRIAGFVGTSRLAGSGVESRFFVTASLFISMCLSPVAAAITTWRSAPCSNSPFSRPLYITRRRSHLSVTSLRSLEIIRIACPSPASSRISR